MVPVYLEEWYVRQRKDKPEPWQSQTKHRLHLKAFTSAIREVYGLGGVSDEVDRDVLEAQRPDPTYHTAVKVESMAAKMDGKFTMPLTVVEDAEPNPEQPTSDAPEMKIYDEFANVEADGITPVKDPIIIDAPCGFKGCSGMAVARCGECGDWVCAGHLGANGFSCKKHEGGA